MLPWKTQKQVLWFDFSALRKGNDAFKATEKSNSYLEFYALEIILPKQKWNKDN